MREHTLIGGKLIFLGGTRGEGVYNKSGRKGGKWGVKHAAGTTHKGTAKRGGGKTDDPDAKSVEAKKVNFLGGGKGVSGEANRGGFNEKFRARTEEKKGEIREKNQKKGGEERGPCQQ